MSDNKSLDDVYSEAIALYELYKSNSSDSASPIIKFHPSYKNKRADDVFSSLFTVGDAQLVLAREHGFENLLEWHGVIASENKNTPPLAHHERVSDIEFRQAIDLIDSGEHEELVRLLAKNPQLVRERVNLESGDYFSTPTLLEFCAENPTRCNSLPENIVEIAKSILDAGAKENQQAKDSLLALVCSGRIVRECGVQLPLIELLYNYGANVDLAMHASVSHGEFEAVNALIAFGATVTLSTAAAIGDMNTIKQLYADASPIERHHALAQAAQHGHANIVTFLLEQSEDPNRFNPDGSHAHSTPLHQAAIAGHLDVVKTLVKYGANVQVKDTLHNAAPVDWAKHGGDASVIDYLTALGDSPNM